MDEEWLWASNGRILSPFRAICVHFQQFDDFDEFASVANGLALIPEGPRT